MHRSRNMKFLGTGSSVQASGGRWWKWPRSQPTAAADIFDDKERLASLDWDRIVVFNGKWCFPPITIRPRIEAWKHKKLTTETKLLLDPEKSTCFGTKNVLLVGAGLVVVGGLFYYVRRLQRKRFEAKVASAAAASVQDAFQGAIDQGVQGAQAIQSAAFLGSIGLALQNAVQDAAPPEAKLDLQDALVHALKDAAVKEAIGLAVTEAISSVQTPNVTAGEATEGHLDASDEKERNVATFLDSLGVVVSEPTLQAGIVKVKDLVTSSVQELVECGLKEENAVKVQKAVSYLLRHSLL